MTFDVEWIIQRYKTLSSTMDQSALLGQSGARDRTAVVCDEQTAGRGRAGRSWLSPPGAAVYCTLILRPEVKPDRLPTLSLVTGVAVAEAIEAVTGKRAQLKWPNDVWLGDDPAHQKVAGILLTSKLAWQAIEYVLVGIGINVATPLADLPPGATSLLAASGVHVQPSAVFAALLERFDTAYVRYLATRGNPPLDEWNARAALLHELVAVEDGGWVHRGIFVGIDDDGALLLREENMSVRRIVAGDLVRGPRVDRS
jgi:BirA family biotin operon repressor/biotin-[acetyl-CoA-carboxylase] ligase